MDADMVIYAGFWRRALALIVDFVLLYPVLFVYYAVSGLSIPVAIAATLLMMNLTFAYPVYFLSRWGQTIGKMAAKIEVTRLDGHRITLGQAWLRSSVDIGLGAINLVAMIHLLATWTGPEWSSLTWQTRAEHLARVNPISWVSHAWALSELLVLLLNKKRRALHDFIAGTVVVRLPD